MTYYYERRYDGASLGVSLPLKLGQFEKFQIEMEKYSSLVGRWMSGLGS